MLLLCFLFIFGSGANERVAYKGQALINAVKNVESSRVERVYVSQNTSSCLFISGASLLLRVMKSQTKPERKAVKTFSEGY